MSESGESEISNLGVHSAGVSVSRDTGTKVDLILRFIFNNYNMFVQFNWEIRQMWNPKPIIHHNKISSVFRVSFGMVCAKYKNFEVFFNAIIDIAMLIAIRKNNTVLSFWASSHIYWCRSFRQSSLIKWNFCCLSKVVFVCHLFRIGGLRKRRGFFSSLISAFKKPSDPSKMCSNATFTTFNLTSSSLQFSIDVQTERREKRKKGNTNRVDTYTCFIRKFPSSVNPDSAEFEVCFYVY